MIAKQLITHLIPPLKTSDTGERAINWMQEFNVNHLPIVNNEQFLGLISEDDILDMNDLFAPIGNHTLSLFRPFVKEYVHIYEVIKICCELNLTIIPVVDEKENYVGVITLQALVQYFGTLSAIRENGGIIVLEMNKNDYSLSEIARIVESNNALILSNYVSSRPDSTRILVTLKLNIPDLKHVVATFERFNYTVLASYQETEYFDQLKERYDSLMNYLNI
jgi:predicted transcriptional regulator